jgi:hypothetical protein
VLTLCSPGRLNVAVFIYSFSHVVHVDTLLHGDVV